MPPYKIVLADQQGLFRQGIRRIIEEQEHFKIVGEAGDSSSLIRIANDLKPHLLIIDAYLPYIGGIDAFREISRTCHDTKCLFLTGQRDLLQYALLSGANGYLLKQDPDVELIRAIKAIQEGNRYISRLLSDYIGDLLSTGGKTDLDANLSARETQILKMIAEGKLNREIADLLCISVRTVEHHRANMLRKLRLNRPADLVRYAIKKGYVVSPALLIFVTSALNSLAAMPWQP
ncbi:MAG: response regulator transcription factor [Dehalobacterium sp.]